MTGAVDRINAWLIGRIRRPREIRFAADAIEFDGRSYPLTELVRAIGFEEEVFPGRRLGLALEFGAERVVRLNQQDGCWDDVLAALDRLALTSLPSQEWTTRILAGADKVVLRGT